MKKIRWGIIGCGNVTEVKSGPAFNKVKNSELVAVMRRDAEKAQDYAIRHRVSRWYSNAIDLINDPEINAVYIATPPDSHEKYALAAMQAGKPVYLEKPMSVDATSAANIAGKSVEYGTKLCVAHYRRYLPQFLKIRSILDQKQIGEVQAVNLTYMQQIDATGFAPSPDNWRLNPAISGGGIFHDLAPHQLDLMRYYFGKPVTVKGAARNIGGYYEADDMVTAEITFEDNIVFNGLWNFVASPGQSQDICEVIGRRGQLKFSIFTMDRLDIITNGKTDSITFSREDHVQQPMISEVVRYFLDERDNPCSGYDGVTVMSMIDNICRK